MIKKRDEVSTSGIHDTVMGKHGQRTLSNELVRGDFLKDETQSTQGSYREYLRTHTNALSCQSDPRNVERVRIEDMGYSDEKKGHMYEHQHSQDERGGGRI